MNELNVSRALFVSVIVLSFSLVTPVLAPPEIWSYMVTNIPFTWDETGTLLFGGGDDTYGTYPLPFSFPFYGYYYNTLYIGSNGYITFDHGHTSYSPSTIWGTIFLTSPTIAVMGKDLVPQVYVSNHGNYVTIRWYGRAYGYPPDHDLMQVQLYDSGDIIMSYSDWQYTECAGVSKGDGTTYVTITPSSGTSFQFVPIQVPSPVIPEYPLGTITASAAIMITVLAYAAVPKLRRKRE